jgi:hypothetical protein
MLAPDLDGQPSSTTVDVRQKHLGFAQAGTDKTDLATGDVLTCMGLVAVHRKSGLAFMMHLDVPWYDNSVSTALTELRDRCGAESLDEVELYDVAGITPWLSVAAAISVLCLFAWSSKGVFIGCAGFATVLAFFLSTRVRTRCLLRNLGFKQPTLLTRADAIGKPLTWWDFRINVRISTTGDHAFVPVLTLPSIEERDPRFEVTEQIAASGRNWWREKARGVRAWSSGAYVRAAGSK